MNTKKVVGAAVILVTVVGLLVVFVGIPLTQTSFHYERQYPSEGDRFVSLRINDFDTTPTDITIRFVDDPTLMYSIDVEQYESGTHHGVNFLEYEDHFSVSVVQAVYGSQTSSIDITLGTGTYYNIDIDSHELDVSVTYDNGAIIDGQYLHLSCANTTFELIFTENVNFTDSGLEVRALLDIDTVLNIDLPDGMNGIVTFPSTVSHTFTTVTGWFQESSGGSNIYKTVSTTEPLFDYSHETLGAIGGTLQN